MLSYEKYINSFLETSQKQKRKLNIFWIGFSAYSISLTYSATSSANDKICQAIQLIGLILLAFSSFSLIKPKFDSLYIILIYSLYYFWLFILIVRGFTFLFDYSYLKVFLFSSWYGGMLYFVPLIFLFKKNFTFYKKIFDVIALFGIIFIVFDIIFIKDLLTEPVVDYDMGIIENFSDLSFASGFVLLTLAYHSKKKQVIAIITIVLALLFATIRARRGLILMYSNIILISYFFYVYNSKYRVVIIYSSILIVLMSLVYINAIYKPNESKIFGFLLERGSEDTRTGVELNFYDDMKAEDWAFGRGINGEYFCPNIEENLQTNYRSVIETGYLQMILKGGILSLGLFLLIALPAIFLGLFMSKNTLSKAAALWIFLSLLKLYPTIENTFSLHYLIVWISIGICYTKEIRNLPEQIIKYKFLNDDKI